MKAGAGPRDAASSRPVPRPGTPARPDPPLGAAAASSRSAATRRRTRPSWGPGRTGHRRARCGPEWASAPPASAGGPIEARRASHAADVAASVRPLDRAADNCGSATILRGAVAVKGWEVACRSVPSVRDAPRGDKACRETPVTRARRPSGRAQGAGRGDVRHEPHPRRRAGGAALQGIRARP